MSERKQWIPFTSMRDMMEDARALRPLPAWWTNHRMFRTFEDPDGWGPGRFGVEKANPGMSRPYATPMTWILFSLTGYTHAPSAGDAKVTIFPDENRVENRRREREDEDDHDRFADYSNRRHTAVRFTTTCGNPGAFPILIDLCCEQVPEDLLDECDPQQQVEWYFRYIRGGWAYTYYIYDSDLIDATLWSLKNIRDRVESGVEPERYSHISGWENLGRLLHLSFLTSTREEGPSGMKNTHDPAGYLLWAVFCEKWKRKDYTRTCEYKTWSRNIKILYTPGDDLQVFEDGDELVSYDYTVRGAISDQLVEVPEEVPEEVPDEDPPPPYS